MVKVEASVQSAYDEVRDDKNSTTFALITYSDDGKSVQVLDGDKGESYDTCLARISDDMRCYVFLRVETGDELSKRAKFALLTFVGESVGALKKAKVSTDKADIKKVIQVSQSFIIFSPIELLSLLFTPFFRTKQLKQCAWSIREIVWK